MSIHDPILPTAAPQSRADGWSPARQRRFLDVLAASGVIMLACEAVRITARSAYALRTRHDGAAFRLGWDAAILIARARLATDLLARAITGNEETIRKDPDNYQVTRHRHDNRLAMSMLSRLDRMADSPAEGSDAALARVVAQDFAAYLDMICPEDVAQAELDGLALPHTGEEPRGRTMADAQLLDGSRPATPEPVVEAVAASISSGACAALFVAARMPLAAGQNPQSPVADERCELRPEPAPEPQPEPEPNRSDLPPEEAAARLRGHWWSSRLQRWRTDFPPPPGFTGDATSSDYDVDDYDRDLTPDERAAMEAEHAAWLQPYEMAAARARDAYFHFAPTDEGLTEETSETPEGKGTAMDAHPHPVPA